MYGNSEIIGSNISYFPANPEAAPCVFNDMVTDQSITVATVLKTQMAPRLYCYQIHVVI